MDLSANISDVRPRRQRTFVQPREDLRSDPWRQRLVELAGQADGAYLAALRATGSQALAEEAVQEAFAKLIRLPIRDEGQAQARVYLIKTARSLARDLQRS